MKNVRSNEHIGQPQIESNRSIEDYPDALTVDEVKDILRVSRNTAYGLVKGDMIPSVQFGRCIRVSKTAVVNFLEQNA